MPKASFFFAACLLAPILIALGALSSIPVSAANTFSFASMSDAQLMRANFTKTVNQIANLSPDLVIFNGDLEIDGVNSTELTSMVTVIKNAGLFNQTFLVRGNHDNHITGSAGLWEKYFETSPNIKVLPEGVTNYVSLNSSSSTLNYSFIYRNAMFIGLDVPGGVEDELTSTEMTFLDTRLTYGESRGLDHAFIYFHGPLYCVESSHCTCSTKTDASCTPSALVSVLNKHPIVSATFHGHEHVLGWVHMSSARVAGITGSFEQFLTSPSGGIMSGNIYTARVDAYKDIGGAQGFASILVDGASFTVNFYKVGTSAPIWSKTFTNDYRPKPTTTYTRTPSRTKTATFTPSRTKTATFTPSRTKTATFTPSVTPTGTYTSSPTNTDTPTSTTTETTTYTPTPTNTETPTGTTTETNTFTPTPTGTSTQISISTETQTLTFTPTYTVTNTPTPTKPSITPPTSHTLYLPLVINSIYLTSKPENLH